MTPTNNSLLKLALPKGRIQDGVFRLIQDAGMTLRGGTRAYKPTISIPDCDVKILKPQNIVEMLHIGRRDIGFAGADWVAELEAEVVELFDTGLDPVRLVAAAPEELLENGKLPQSSLVIASEYRKLTLAWIEKNKLHATFVRSYGATEVFPPEDADCIVDNTSTGATLQANGLQIIDELMRSSTKLYANPRALEDKEKREGIERFVLLLQSVIDARTRVMLEVNIPSERLEDVLKILPCMREHTISPLHGDAGYAVKAAVLRNLIPTLIPEIKMKGGTDIIVTNISQLVP